MAELVPLIRDVASLDDYGKRHMGVECRDALEAVILLCAMVRASGLNALEHNFFERVHPADLHVLLLSDEGLRGRHVIAVRLLRLFSFYH